MNPGIGARLKRMAKVVATLCAIEMFLPAGTLLVLGLLLSGRISVPAPAGGPVEWGRSALRQVYDAWSATRMR